jgi:hypothetical protein
MAYISNCYNHELQPLLLLLVLEVVVVLLVLLLVVLKSCANPILKYLEFQI